MADETVRIDVVLNAHAAIGELQKMNKETTHIEENVSRLGDFFVKFSQKTKTPLSETQKLFKDINSELTSLGGKPLFEDDVLKITQKYNKLREAAGVFKTDNQGVVTSLSAVEDRALAVSNAIEKLYAPQQQRNALGRFTNQFLPDFGTQLKNATDYNSKLQLVQRTISDIAKKTGESFRGVGAALEKAFPDLKNTNLVSTAIDNLNKKAMGLSGTFKSLKQVAMQVDIELAKMAAAGKFAFGGNNAQNVTSLVSALKEIKTATGASFEQIAAGMRRMGVDGAYVRQALKQVNSELGVTKTVTKGAAGEIEILGNRLNLVRTAFGTLLAVGIFQFLQGLSAAFKELLHNIRETELAVYNLINAERRLSEEGIEVTPKGLQETIDSVRELVPILSQIQAEELVSRIATNVAPALKLTNEQIRQMAESVALLYVRNKALGKSFDEVEAQLTNAFLTGKVSQGINNLGVKLSDQIVRDEALRLGLVETEKEFNNLTGEMEAQVKAAAMLSVVYQNASQDIESIGDYMETTDAQIEKTKTAWDNLLTVAGTAFGPAIAEGLKIVANGIELIIKLLDAGKPTLRFWVANMVALAEATKNLPQYAKLGGGAEFLRNFAEAQNRVMDSFKELGEIADTPTATGLGEALDTSLKDAEEFEQKIEDILEDAANAREDLETKLSQKRSDIDTEYQRKALDAAKDYGRKVEDIERDYQRDLAKIKEKQRADDLKAEENYQLKLWELQMRFLMDLEEALHARDARQVIRLQKQYEIDKEALERKQKLDDKQRESDQAAELEDAKIKRDQRLEDAKIEYEQKLSDQRLAKQRELDDLNVWYKREQEDIQKNIQRKLEALIDGWVDEKKITEQNAAEVYAILAKYFGPGGMTDQLYAYLASRFATPIPMPTFAPMTGYSLGGGLASSTGATTGGRTTGATTGGGTRTVPRRNNIPMAEGGTLIATRPTSVLFGEAGPEMAQFTPLSRLGRNVNTVFSNGNEGGALSGQIVVALDLSPDLEARVMENTVNGVADVVLKVNRTKL